MYIFQYSVLSGANRKTILGNLLCTQYRYAKLNILLNFSNVTLIKRSFLLRSKSEELSHRAYEGQLVQNHEKDSEDAPTPRPNPEPFSTSAEVLVFMSLILGIESLKVLV